MIFTPEGLIIGYLEGRMDASQKAAFFKWVNEEPENKRLFFETKAVYESARPLPDAETMDASWERLAQLAQLARVADDRKKSATVNDRQRTFAFRFLRYAAAASVAALLTAGGFFWSRNDTPPTTKGATPQTVAYHSGNGLTVNTLTLPDGSTVMLGNSTKLHYDSNFGTTTRELKLEGEALFMVAKMPDKPFIVHAKGMKITALGTTFNVMAYPADSIVTATLVEGSINVSLGTSNKKLQPDEHIVFNEHKKTFYVSIVDTEDITRWTTGYYVFENETFRNIMHRLSNVYGLDIQIKSKRLAATKFKGTFYSGQKITDILTLMQLTLPFTYSVKGDEIIINHKKMR